MTCGEGCIFRGHLRFYLNGWRAQAFPILMVLMYFCLHPLTENDKIRHGNTNTYGEERVLGCQPRHMRRAQMRRAVCQRWRSFL